MYSGKILMLLAVSVFLVQIGVGQAETSTPYAIPSITSGDNVVTLSPSNVPVVKAFRRGWRRGYYRYRPYSYSYGYYPYSYYYGYPYYYSYRVNPYGYYRPYAYGW
jgi:hypothetical protein